MTHPLVPFLLLVLTAGAASVVSAAPPAEPKLFDPSGRVLTRLHRSLRLTDRGAGQTRVLQFGASHTAADLFTGYLRHRLQERFGDAGHGYVMPVVPWRGYRHTDVVFESSGEWRTDRAFGGESADDGFYGLAGFACSTSSCDARAQLGTAPRSRFGAKVSRFEVFFLKQPGGGSFDVFIDEGHYDRISTRGTEPEAGYSEIRVPDGPHTLEIRPRGDGEVRLFGVVMERSAPGVVVDTLGINGARASVWLKWDEAIWRSQVRRRAADLVVLAYGTNETGDDHEPIGRYTQNLRAVLERLKSAAPDAACVLVGPTDRPVEVKRGRKKVFVERPRTADIIRAQKLAAREFGCGFFDLVDAMGGPGSMVRWVKQGLAQKDHVHLTARGYSVLSERFVNALLDGYEPRSAAR